MGCNSITFSVLLQLYLPPRRNVQVTEVRCFGRSVFLILPLIFKRAFACFVFHICGPTPGHQSSSMWLQKCKSLSNINWLLSEIFFAIDHTPWGFLVKILHPFIVTPTGYSLLNILCNLYQFVCQVQPFSLAHCPRNTVQPHSPWYRTKFRTRVRLHGWW